MPGRSVRRLILFVIAVLRLLEQIGITFANDLPLAQAIISCDGLLGLEDALDDHSSLWLDRVLRLALGRCLGFGLLLDLGVDLGFLLLSGEAASLLGSAVLPSLNSLEGVGETLPCGRRRFLLRWLRRLLRFVPELAFFDLFLYSFFLHFFFGVVLVVGDILIVVIALVIVSAVLLAVFILGSLLLLCFRSLFLFLLLLGRLDLLGSSLFVLSLTDSFDFVDAILLNALLLPSFLLLELLLLGHLCLLGELFPLLLQVSFVGRRSAPLAGRCRSGLVRL